MPAPAQEDYGPRGEAERHLPLAELERRLAQLPPPPADAGTVHLIVARRADGVRETIEQLTLTPERGIPGDRWERRLADRPEMQITAIRRDVAELIANGQPLTTFGDNLVVELDLSARNLPAGTRIRVGDALVEVSPFPHDGCVKFKGRFGTDALRFVAGKALRDLNLRGIYWTAIEPGAVGVGSAIQVLERG